MIRWKVVFMYEQERLEEKGEEEMGEIREAARALHAESDGSVGVRFLLTRRSARNELRCAAHILQSGCPAADCLFLSVSLSARTRTSRRDSQPQITQHPSSDHRSRCG